MEVSSSLLNVDKEKAVQTFYRLEMAHTDYFHIDVMDGEFVENNTIELMKDYADTIKNISNIPLDIHLMVKDVKKYVDMFSACEPKIIHFHIEAIDSKEDVLNTINYIKENNCKVGLAINPKTNIESIYEYLPLIHTVMIMSVEPGKGGQKFIEDSLQKIQELKKYLNDENLDCEIEVDGGVNYEVAESLKNVGADIVVVGSFLINSKDYKFAINKIKNS